MIRSLTISPKKFSAKPVALLIALVYMSVLILALREYLLWQSVNFLLGIGAMVMVTTIDRQKLNSQRYAWLSVVLALLACWIPVKTLLFFSIVFAFFFLIETYFGRLNSLPLLVAGLMSPFFQYISALFSFPIRLELSKWAGKILSMINPDVLVQGNIITYQQQEFSVDTTCMGLKMMVTSLLLSTILLSIYQRRTGKRAGWLLMGFFFTEIFALNIIANLIRIVCLIQFEIPPASVFHELTGILCLLLYVIAPAMISCNWMIKKWGKPTPGKNDDVVEMRNGKRLGLHVLLMAAIIVSAFKVKSRDVNMDNNTASVPSVSGYTCQRVKADVVKLENNSSLIYLKAIPNYFIPDHNPMICWTGSGYNLERIQEEKIESRELYTALLKKEKEELYTAWWYSNGTTHTISQARLRWELLSGGKQFTLINVTAASRQSLELELKSIFRNESIKELTTTSFYSLKTE